MRGAILGGRPESGGKCSRAETIRGNTVYEYLNRAIFFLIILENFGFSKEKQC